MSDNENNTTIEELDDKKGLVWHKWYVRDIEFLAEKLPPEEFKIFIVSVMKSVKTGEPVDFKDNEKLKLLYEFYCNSHVSLAQETYGKKVKAGSEGGKAKAENKKTAEAIAKAEKENGKFPFEQITKSFFRSMAKDVCNEYDITYSQKKADELYLTLCGDSWVYHNFELKKKHQLQTVVCAELSRFDDYRKILLFLITKTDDFDPGALELIMEDIEEKGMTIVDAVNEFVKDDE